ncbi:DUF924 family protein [Vannielia sp.]|uniref:DUF924 family protein n=1 Tax=Vannielia sp. TaxID=2813045 RepID=UPI00262B4B63|nr:DUF924 family protein [Vannielia sp.]MDF1871567.1 DUF924 domain-containing protein [Vannielia sp.]
MEQAEDILRFWVDEIGPEGWYAVDDAVDAEIRKRFGGLWQDVHDDALRGWRNTPEGVLAYLVLTDQFPRNMFRGDGRSFATDARARQMAKWAIENRFDRRIDGPKRQFFYLPLMHSEVLADQDRAVRCFMTRMSQGNNLEHARAHRQVIRDFSRFPYRNEALARVSSEKEKAYLAAGGYGWTYQRIEKGEAAGWGSSG